MIAVDTNLLVYAYAEESAEHEPALDALAGLVHAGAPWGIPWTVACEFLALVTNRARLDAPLDAADAFAVLDSWLGAGRAQLLMEPPGIYPSFRELAVHARASGPFFHDARIAAACLANGVTEFWTADRDYGRFPALRVRNPLVD